MDKIIYTKKQLYILPKENDEGNREYKLKLIDSDNDKLERLMTQIKYRIYEGKGKALYILGVKDNGVPIGIKFDELIVSVNIIINLSHELNANINKIRIYKGIYGYIATIRIQKYINDENFFYNIS